MVGRLLTRANRPRVAVWLSTVLLAVPITNAAEPPSWIVSPASNGRTLFLRGGATPPHPDGAGKAALSFLQEMGASLRLVPERLAPTHSVSTPAGRVLFYDERVDGLPVFFGQVGVLVDRTDRVRLAFTNARPEGWGEARGTTQWPEDTPRIALEAITGKAHLGPLRILAKERGLHAPTGSLAERLLIGDDAGPAFLVTVGGGGVLDIRYLRHPATISGWIFNPNPVNTLNDPFLSDQGDARSAVPVAAYFQGSIGADDPAGGVYRLRGRYAFVGNHPDLPPDSPATMSTIPEGFAFYRDQNGFEDFNSYFWVSLSGEYVESLGFTLLNLPLFLDVHADYPDGPFFLGVPRDLVPPGEPNAGICLTDSCAGSNVDAGEDADVILHEHSHSLFHGLRDVAFCAGGDPSAINEGSADYWAGSWSYQTSIDNGFDPHCLAEWFVVESDWCLRRTDSSKLYPRDIVGEEHDDGEMWSRFLFDLAARLSSFQALDEILLTAVVIAPDAPTFLDMVDAMVEADRLLNAGANAAGIRAAAAGRGITVLREVSAVERGRPLRVEKIAGGLRILWEDLGPAAEGYNLYEGEIPFWDFYDYALCGTAGQPGPSGYRMEEGQADFPSAFFLVTAYARGGEGPAGCAMLEPYHQCIERDTGLNWCPP